MEERRSRLSITISFGGRRDRGDNRGSAVSTESPKSPKANPLHSSLGEQPWQRDTRLASVDASQQPPSPVVTEEAVQGTFAEPRRPSLALLSNISLPFSHPTMTRLPSQSIETRNSLPAIPTVPSSTETHESAVSNPSVWTRFRKYVKFLTLNHDKAHKQRMEERATTHVIYALFVFCTTAILYIALAFSLPNFPNFLHVVFIGLLFVEFACVIKTLLNKSRHARKRLKRSSSVQDGPPAGAIIQGAQNWDDVSDDLEAGQFNLEAIGTEEALKPIPPAYGIYRGSVRIGDNDISWVRRTDEAPPTIEEVEAQSSVGEGVPGRPPSYASDGGRL